MRDPRFFRWTDDLFGDPNTGGVQKFLAGPARDPKVPAWPCPAGLAWPGRPGLAWPAWPDLAEKGARIWVKYGLGGCHMGHQGLGCTWVDPYRCQDAFPGLVGPFWATGGRFGAIFHISRFPIFFRIIFSIFPIIPGVAGLLFTGGRTAKKEGGSCAVCSEAIIILTGRPALECQGF